MTTWMAPVGTVARMAVGETTANLTFVPLKVTLVAPVRSVPRIVITDPGLRKVGTGLTNGGSRIEKRKAVP